MSADRNVRHEGVPRTEWLKESHRSVSTTAAGNRPEGCGLEQENSKESVRRDHENVRNTRRSVYAMGFNGNAMKSRRSVNDGVQRKAPTGITGFDEMTGGGLPHGRTTLLAGGPGSGKTIFALRFWCMALGSARSPEFLWLLKKPRSASWPISKHSAGSSRSCRSRSCFFWTPTRRRT